MLRFVAGRIDYQTIEQRDEIIKKYASECKEIIIYEHVERADNLHVHMLMETALTLKTLRNYAVKLVGKNESNDSRLYSFIEKQSRGPDKGSPVSIKFISYMSKGKYDPIWVNPNSNKFTPALVEQYRLLGFDKEDVKKGIVSEGLKQILEEKKSRLTEWDMVKEVVGTVDASGYSVFNLNDDLMYTTKEIYPYAKQVREKHKRLLPAKAMAEFVQKCKYFLNPDDYADAVGYWDSYISGKKYSM